MDEITPSFIKVADRLMTDNDNVDNNMMVANANDVANSQDVSMEYDQSSNKWVLADGEVANLIKLTSENAKDLINNPLEIISVIKNSKFGKLYVDDITTNTRKGILVAKIKNPMLRLQMLIF